MKWKPRPRARAAGLASAASPARRVDVGIVVAVSCFGVHILAEFAGVEEGVVVVADGEGDRVRGRRM